MSDTPKVGFVSLGCPKALTDSELILTQLSAEGYQTSKTFEGADLVIVNTCGFIDDAVKESLDTIGEALSANGRVIVTVPAHKWMWSAHDQANHHKRRYTTAMLRASLDAAGLEPVKFTYYNTLLFPLAAVKKFIDRRKDVDEATSEVDQPSPLVNTLFKAIFESEKHVVPAMNLPYGVSLLAVAKPK